MLSKLSIRAKLIAIISFLLITLAGTGLLAIIRMQTLNGHTVDIATNWLPSVRVLGEFKAELQRYRGNLRHFVLVTEPQDRAAVEKLMETVAQKMDQLLKAYDVLVTSPEERVLADEIGQHWKEYSPLAREVMDSARKDNDITKARDLIVSKTVPLGRKIDAILNKDIDLNNK